MVIDRFTNKPPVGSPMIVIAGTKSKEIIRNLWKGEGNFFAIADTDNIPV